MLAVAFLIAGLALGAKGAEQRAAQTGTRTLTTPRSKARASGQGQPVGQVYRLADGTLVLKSAKP